MLPPWRSHSETAKITGVVDTSRGDGGREKQILIRQRLAIEKVLQIIAVFRTEDLACNPFVGDISCGRNCREGGFLGRRISKRPEGLNNHKVRMFFPDADAFAVVIALSRPTHCRPGSHLRRARFLRIQLVPKSSNRCVRHRVYLGDGDVQGNDSLS